MIKSPEKRCGKTRLLELIEATSSNPVSTVNASAAAIFRLIEQSNPRPTLLLDEADTVFGSKFVAERNEDLRGIFNAGFARGASVLRVSGPNHEPMLFDTFAMAALAGIGAMPDTIEDRAIIVTMRRRTGPAETVQQFRWRTDRPAAQALGDRLAEWCSRVSDQLDRVPDVTPLEDRAADRWEPLFAIAAAAGGAWPEAARNAATVLEAQAEEIATQASLGTQLLTDIRDVFDVMAHVTFLGSNQLVQLLRGIEDGPWQTLDLTASKMADMLRPYGIKSGHSASGHQRGYQRAKLVEPFQRYLPPAESPSGDVSALEAA